MLARQPIAPLANCFAAAGERSRIVAI